MLNVLVQINKAILVFHLGLQNCLLSFHLLSLAYIECVKKNCVQIIIKSIIIFVIIIIIVPAVVVVVVVIVIIILFIIIIIIIIIIIVSISIIIVSHGYEQEPPLHF